MLFVVLGSQCVVTYQKVVLFLQVKWVCSQRDRVGGTSALTKTSFVDGLPKPFENVFLDRASRGFRL